MLLDESFTTGVTVNSGSEPESVLVVASIAGSVVTCTGEFVLLAEVVKRGAFSRSVRSPWVNPKSNTLRYTATNTEIPSTMMVKPTVCVRVGHETCAISRRVS